MNYQCNPDIDPKQVLTVDAVSLFQRFRQDADTQAVGELLDQEFARHIKLCELAILHAAEAGIDWCELPRNPLGDFNLWASQHLEKMGFEIEHCHTAREEAVPCELDRKKTLTAVVVRSSFVAKWFLAKPLQPKVVSAEWHRREALEGKDLVENPPQRQSSGLGAAMEYGAAVWASVLDGKYVVEVQRINQRSYLCLFEVGGRFLHAERTNVAYGAMFGPDAADVDEWSRRAVEIGDGWRAGGSPG